MTNLRELFLRFQPFRIIILLEEIKAMNTKEAAAISELHEKVNKFTTDAGSIVQASAKANAEQASKIADLEAKIRELAAGDGDVNEVVSQVQAISADVDTASQNLSTVAAALSGFTLSTSTTVPPQVVNDTTDQMQPAPAETPAETATTEPSSGEPGTVAPSPDETTPIGQ